MSPHPISIRVNGQTQQVEPNIAVAALIANMPLAGKRFAVERNGEIVPKSQLGNTPVHDGDTFEIVIAVGGG
jgi:sulfur carrier protein